MRQRPLQQQIAEQKEEDRRVVPAPALLLGEHDRRLQVTRAR
ncbi:MAG: hypothetical protein VBE63_27435 [Lamprobacter sp.]|nr:hypothetical protein [Lamprobacter sp.]MEA3643633.1 hypothetical protein [Lamprobacter sp.]